MSERVGSVFREVMAQVCTPVAVVTAFAGHRPHGSTVSAFCSLSMEPSMVLVALDRRSDLLAILRRNGGIGNGAGLGNKDGSGKRFGLNVLSSDQSALATTFAKKGPDKFATARWHSCDGAPRLAGAAGWLACEVDSLVDGGDHVIALGVVVAAEPSQAEPLTYHRRIFGTHRALVADEDAGLTRV